MTPISIDRLKEVAALAPEPEARSQRANNVRSDFNIQNWIDTAAAKMGWDIGAPRSGKHGGLEWRFRGMCPFQPNYQDANAAIFQASDGVLGVFLR
jgi:hypothetical protein